MNLIVCIDDNFGMMFNKRRQSQDRLLREFILSLTQNSILWMNHYSAKQFVETAPQINIDDNFLSEAAPGEYCFVEDRSIQAYYQWVEKVILCKWNRVYPSDLIFDISLEGWSSRVISEFSGSSHEKITVEEWVK